MSNRRISVLLNLEQINYLIELVQDDPSLNPVIPALLSELELTKTLFEGQY